MGNIESTEKQIGFALLIHHDKFEDQTLQEREGNDVDVNSTTCTLTKLGFVIEEVANPTAQQIKNKINSVANDEEYSGYQCLVVIIMTHGSNGGKLYAKDDFYFTNHIWEPLIKCKNFEKDPKILIFQACRGKGIELATVEGCIPRPGKSIPFYIDCEMPLLPHDSSFFLAFSTVENKNALRNTAKGSWYIQSVCNVIDSLQFLHKYDNNLVDESIDLLSLMTEVTHDMIRKCDNGFAQTPSYISFLSKLLYVRIRNNDTMSIQSATSSSSSSTLSGNVESECATTSEMQHTGSDIQFDGEGNAPNPPASHYSWKRKQRGRCLIFYDIFHKSISENVKSTLESLQFQPEVIEIIDTETDFITSRLGKVASEVQSLADCNCLLVVILSKITKLVKNNKELEETHVAFNTCIEDTWSPFIAVRCKELHGIPKIFFYLDNLQTTDSEMPPRLQMDSHHSIVTDHADFFYVFGYGEEFISSLCTQLKNGYASQLELHKIVTKSIEQGEEMLKRLNNRINMKKVPYFKSTLSLEFIFGYEKKTKLIRFNAYKEKMENQNYKLNSKNNIQDGNCLPILKKLKSLKYSKEKALEVDDVGNTLLHKAARERDFDSVEELVSIHHIDINSKNKNGNTPVQMAVMSDSLEIIKYLINKGANINDRQGDGATLLQMACLFGTINVVKWLIDNGAEIDAIRPDGDTALQVSAAYGKLDMVKYLVENGADVNYEKVDKTTALMMACHCGVVDTYGCMEYLVKNNAEINVKMYTGKSPLYLAVASNRIDKVKFLIENDADISIKTNDGVTILQAAAQYSNIDMLNYLFDNNIDLYDTRIDGCTALHITAEYGKIENLKWLLNKGFNINIKSLDGSTPLHKAVMCSTGMEIVDYLIENGAYVNEKKKNGDTPLHISCELGYLLISQKLYEKNANINEINCNEWTPLHKAVKKGSCDIVKWLINIDNIDLNLKNELGQNALDIAIRFNKNQIIKILKEKMYGSNMDTS